MSIESHIDVRIDYAAMYVSHPRPDCGVMSVKSSICTWADTNIRRTLALTKAAQTLVLVGSL
jgi:hypothetical protein